MTNILLIVIAVMVLITMVCSIITTIIMTKETKSEKIVTKVLKIVGIILGIVLILGIAIGVSYIKGDNGSKEETETVTLETAGFNEVTLDEYLNLIKGTEKSIILVARPTCGFCEQFTPILKQAMDEMNLTINYIDTDKFDQDEYTTFNNSLDYLKNNQWGTPLVLIVQNNQVVSQNEGYVELDTIKDFFKNNGFGE